MLNFFDVIRYKLNCTLASLEGSPVPHHPLADNVEHHTDRQVRDAFCNISDVKICEMFGDCRFYGLSCKEDGFGECGVHLCLVLIMEVNYFLLDCSNTMSHVLLTLELLTSRLLF